MLRRGCLPATNPARNKPPTRSFSWGRSAATAFAYTGCFDMRRFKARPVNLFGRRAAPRGESELEQRLDALGAVRSPAGGFGGHEPAGALPGTTRPACAGRRARCGRRRSHGPVLRGAGPAGRRPGAGTRAARRPSRGWRPSAPRASDSSSSLKPADRSSRTRCSSSISAGSSGRSAGTGGRRGLRASAQTADEAEPPALAC